MSEKNEDVLNAALIGYGYAGRTFHAPLLRSTPGMKLAAVVSSSAEKVTKDLPDVRVEAEASKIFADKSIDLIVIATPNATHFPLAQQALEAGKNVVVDKPFVTTPDEASKLIILSDKQRCLLSVFQNRRWDADFRTLNMLLATGCIGEPTYLQSNFDRFRPTIQDRWREQDVPGGGLWFDLGAHLADQVMALLGAPDTVTADLEKQRDRAKAVDYFHVILAYGEKRVVLHGSSLVLGQSPRYIVHGTAGSYVKYGLDTQEQSLKDGKLPGTGDWGIDPEEGTLYTKNGDTTTTKKIPNERGDYVAYYSAVCQAIVHGDPNPVAAKEALAVMSLLELANQSASQGKTLEFKLLA